jgi:hypothetical protein
VSRKRNFSSIPTTHTKRSVVITVMTLIWSFGLWVELGADNPLLKKKYSFITTGTKVFGLGSILWNKLRSGKRIHDLEF